jgi:acylphosphatase
MVHKKITIIGRVQGVGFRYSARLVAQSLNLNGFVKNMPNNEVYIEVEGEENQVDIFIKWCNEGPPHARIDNVIVYPGSIIGYKEFVITH